MNRRDIIKAGMSSVALTLVPSVMVKASANSETMLEGTEGPYSTLVKHGHPKTEAIFVWSVMTVNDPAGFLSMIDGILSKHNYRSEIRYSSTDKYKIDPAKQIIDYILNDKNVSFDIKIFNVNPRDFHKLSPTEYNGKIENLYKETVPSGINGSIASKVEDRYGPSDSYNEKFQQRHGIKNNTKNPKLDKIIQVNDLVSGIIYSIFAENKSRSKVKLELNDYLNSKFSFEKSNGNLNIDPFKISKIII
ncbi:MAG: hypothetical protein KA536_06450 [Saprospiraceae bacterium]|nr:hypothetical protein [Saprospiraceae bacterium]